MSRCQRGFSYIQILLGSAFIAGLALVGIELMKNQERVSRNTSQRFEVGYITNEIAFILSSPASCLESFEGLNAKDDKGNISQIMRALPGGEARVRTYRIFSESQKLYGQENIAIESYALSDSSPEVDAERGSTHLIIEFDKGKNTVGSRKLKRSLRLAVETDEQGRITGCVTLENQKPTLGQWETDGAGNLFWPAGSIAIQTAPGQSRVRLGKGLTLKGDESLSCSQKNRGLLKFNSKQSRLEFCGKQGKWKNFGSTPLNWKESVKYSLNRSTPGAQTLATGPHRVCLPMLVERGEAESGCEFRALESNAVTSWELKIFTSTIAKTNCEWRCFN